MRNEKANRDIQGREGFEIVIRGVQVRLGRAGVVLILSGVAAVLYAIARSW